MSQVRIRPRGDDAREAVRETMQTTGQALLFTSLVLCTGFFVFMFGTMHNTFNFGLLTGFALAVAFVANVTPAPSLMTLLTSSGRRREAAGPGSTTER
jgi:predicted RND superfamily exporter protein